MDKAAFVQKVKSICLMKDVKPTNACKESGVGGSFLNDIERGRTPSVQRVQMLAAYLGVTTSELLDEEKKPAPVSGSEPLCPPGYALLSPANRVIVDQLVDSLLENQPPLSAPFKVSAAALGGQTHETVADSDVTLPGSGVHGLPGQYMGGTDNKAPAQEET